MQSTKQRVSELERTLSSVSTQQKQFEKVVNAQKVQEMFVDQTNGILYFCDSLSAAQQRVRKRERRPEAGDI